MAHIEQRGDSWRAIVQRKGSKKQSKTFRTKDLAERWARKIEHQIDQGASVTRPEGTVGKIFDRYMDEVADNKPSGGKWERIRLTKMAAAFGDAPLDSDLVARVVDWRKKRLVNVSEGTVRREMSLLSGVFTHAKKEWRININNPCHEMRWPKDNPARKRRISLVEEQQLLDRMGFDWAKPPTILKSYTPWVFLFALETAMRLGEILSLEWGQVAEKWVTLEKTKNGDSRVVPLSSRARQIIATMPKVGKRVFMVRPGTFDQYWRDVRPDGLHFHDTRATALSRLAPKFQPMELAKISGHRDLNMLLNTYYRPTPDELADRLD